MTALVHDLLSNSAARYAARTALHYRDQTLRYDELQQHIERCASALNTLLPQAGERVAIYLPKQFETVIALFACSRAGAVFVPINPALKPAQVQHILTDCDVRILITNAARSAQLKTILPLCPSLHTIIYCDDESPENIATITPLNWAALAKFHAPAYDATRIDHDMAAILYTSGSTGRPKGVVLSHRNLVAGAESVSTYLHNDEHDRVLALLPLSFDYGLSQLTTALRVGASVVLFDYLFPLDVVNACAKYHITGLAAVPPLWSQLARLEWPSSVKNTLRYWTNSGGHMPRTTLARLREQLPHSAPYLMYGLTESFRSTYLPPEQIDQRPDSIGKAIPNAEVLVLRADGSECAAHEAGELVHRGALVALGYWNAADKSAERFKYLPLQNGLSRAEIAVFSGDTVKKDDDGYLYFIGRDDDLIKCNGYRISPTEIEEMLLASARCVEAVVLGVPHDQHGHAIVAIVVAHDDYDEPSCRAFLQQHLPAYMNPHTIIVLSSLPRNNNGKIDRAALRTHYHDLFQRERSQ